MRRGVLIVVALATALAYAVPAGAERSVSDAPAAATDTSHDYVMVTLSSPPTASYEGGIPGLERTKPVRGKLDRTSAAFAAYQDHLSAERASFVEELRRKAPDAEVVRTYSLVLNGVALELNGHSPAEVSRVSGIRAVGSSSLHRPDMNVSVDLLGVPDVWGSLGGQANAGAGLSVGVIDTGIDDGHPFFACKDAIEHDVFASGTAFDPSNLLVFDHGTHVAGTIAGCVFDGADAEPVEVSGDLSGVAPGATLHDYNVFPGFGAGFVAFGGSAFSHDIAAALEQAVADGMDIVNMSLGGGVEGPHDFLAEASNATVDAGTVVVTSAGNSGPGDATVTSPATAEKAISVAAMTNAHFAAVPVGVDGTTYNGAAGDFDPYVDSPAVDRTLVRWNDGEPTVDDLACGDTPDKDVTAAVVLISRGECSFTTKVRAAEDAGAFGVVVYNLNPGEGAIAMAHDGTEPFPTIPALMVSFEDGMDIIDNRLAGDPPSATTDIEGPAVEIAAEPNIIANFSSRGPAPFTFIIKPDITAPGVNVYSSVFDEQFAFFQGTSMSSPHIAGGAALLLDAHPDWMPIDVKSALVNTARRDQFVHDGNGIELLARGGGIAWLPNAIDAPATLDPVNASFGLWTGSGAVQDTIEITTSNGTCTVSDVTHDGGDPVGTIVTATQDGDTVTVSLDAGGASTTSSGDYAGDVVFDCGETELSAPWFVRIDRQAKP